MHTKFNWRKFAKVYRNILLLQSITGSTPPPPPATGDIRLVPYNDDPTLTGYYEVQIYYSDGLVPADYGGVCADNSYKEESKVICHQVGYKYIDFQYRYNKDVNVNNYKLTCSTITHTLGQLLPHCGLIAYNVTTATLHISFDAKLMWRLVQIEKIGEIVTLKTTDYWSNVVRTSLHSSSNMYHAYMHASNTRLEQRDVSQFLLNQYRLHSTTGAVQWTSCSMPYWQQQSQYIQHLFWSGWYILQRLWCLERHKPERRWEATRSIWCRYHLSTDGIYRGLSWNSCHKKCWELWLSSMFVSAVCIAGNFNKRWVFVVGSTV